LSGTTAIGHNRYSTSGSSRRSSDEEKRRSRQNLQPFSKGKNLALVFNGNIANYMPLRRELESQGANFKTDVDTEVIINFLSIKNAPLEERLYEFSKIAKGAYSMIVMEKTKNGNRFLLARDPLGIRPLIIGEIDGKYLVAASETVALQKVRARYLREVEPAEIVELDDNGINCLGFMDRTEKRAHCIFEDIYFTMPESNVFGYSSGKFKEESGRQLALEHKAYADIVVGVPDSATRAAWGYSQQSEIPERKGLNRNNYIGRTFIQPEQFTREMGVRMKFSADPEIVAGKRIVLVDDSIVRGTTTPHVIQLLRDNGAREVHMRVASPPLRYPCFFGVDMPDYHEFAAYNRSVDDVCSRIGADSLGYLSLDGLLKCSPIPPENFCTACFTGDYPIDISAAVEAQVQRIQLREAARV
jgi:amidophosphoribosyltransferase